MNARWLSPFSPALAASGLTLALAAICHGQDLMDDLPEEFPVVPLTAAQDLPEESASVPLTDTQDLPEESAPAPLTAALPEYNGASSSGFTPVATMSRLLDGLSTSLRVASLYDSNLQRGSGGAAVAVGDDFIFNVAPSLAYSNPGTDWTITGTAGVDYTEYMKNSELGGLGGQASIGLGYEGGKIAVSSSFDYSRETGSSRNYDSADVLRDRFNFSLVGSYRVSPKTTLDGSYRHSWDDPQEGFSASTRSTLSTSAMWRYSPRVRIGPGLRYGVQTGEIQDDRITFGPTLRADYNFSSKIALTSEVGLDFVSYDGPDGSSDEFFHARIGADYRPTPLWGFDLSLFRDARADSATVGSYREIFSTRVGLTRRIQRATLAMGVTYETDSQVNTSGAPVVAGDRDYLIFDSILSIPVFRGRSTAAIFYRWRDEVKSDGNSWDGYQIGLNLTTQF